MHDAYALPLGGLIDRHFPADISLLRDREDTHNPKLDALVRSGDYFITLATELENLASELTEISPAAASLALARLSHDLEYVQKRYTIIRKDRPDPLTELG